MVVESQSVDDIFMNIIGPAHPFNRLQTARNFTRFCRFRNIFLKKKCLRGKTFLLSATTFSW